MTGFDFTTATEADLVALPPSYLRVYCDRLGIKAGRTKAITAARIVAECRDQRADVEALVSPKLCVFCEESPPTHLSTEWDGAALCDECEGAN